MHPDIQLGKITFVIFEMFQYLAGYLAGYLIIWLDIQSVIWPEYDN